MMPNPLCVLAIAAACLAGHANAAAPTLKLVQPNECMPEVRDYTYMWWAHGFGQPATGKPQILCFQTGRYGAAIDVQNVQLILIGAIESAEPYLAAATQDNGVVLGLPAGNLGLYVLVGQTKYRCVRGAVNQRDMLDYPVRIIDSGRFVQRADILQLVFEDDKGQRLNAQARLEIEAWPDRACFIVQLTPNDDLADASLVVSLGQQTATLNSDRQPPSRQVFRAGQTQTVGLSVSFGSSHDAQPPADLATVHDLNSNRQAPVAYDTLRGVHRVQLPKEQWPVADEPDRLARFRVTLRNPTTQPHAFRLLFDSPDGTPGITGVSAILRDQSGLPTGIPVQLSKNWHRQPGRSFLYEGPWFHGYTVLRLPPDTSTSLEYTMAWARWGGVPAASHAQLCLIGWGHNQLWDQVAIGSWGESICYEPDMAQGRSIIDDLRPLMVRPMGARRDKWDWTNNVGGGDFLVYHDQNRRRQFLTRMRTAYLSHGPNLTDVIYAGISADGAIAATLAVSTPRCDDIMRSYHRFRYDVLRPITFTRLAFYQLGSDGYNDHQFNLLARGNEKGLIEQWTFAKGGKRYDRLGIPCEGLSPWFSLHDAISRDNKGGAWANRGMVIRSFKARLAGRDVPYPFASCYGTENGPPSMNVELSPPPGLTQLQTGDFVEALVELLVIPMAADDYYGPNDNLRASLKADANTFRPVLRQATGNNLRLHAIAGRLLRSYPPLVLVDASQSAEIEITGGLAYLPISFTGLNDFRTGGLTISDDRKPSRVDQSVHGNDYWQTDYDPAVKTWTLTYNVNLDTLQDQPRTVRLSFNKAADR